MRYMLDTNICIYVISGNHKNESVRRRIADHLNQDLCISSITLSELEYGICKSSRPAQNRFALYSFLSSIPVLDYDSRAAVEYGKLRALLEQKGKPIGSMDQLIAAHALAEDCILVTANSREFEHVPDLHIENWTL